MSSEDFRKILENPRAHTGRGYRRRVDRSADLDVDVEMEMDADDADIDNDMDADADADVEDDFDQELTPDADANMDADAAQNANPEEHDAAGADANANADADADATYYAKNDTYNFKTQGHSNRRVEMSKLHQSNEFSKWEEAAKKEWAVVHAKFYISLPQSQSWRHGGRGQGRGRGHEDRRNPRGRGGRGQGRGQGRGHGRTRRQGKKGLEKLPEQAKVIDVKAAENATLGTKFQATGVSQNQPMRRSAVRMDRIKGLTDDDDWKGGPLFECKMYYRAEDVISGVEGDRDSDDECELGTRAGTGTDQNMNMNMNGEEEEEEEVASKLLQEVSLEAYKTETINQVKQYHVENMTANPEDAEDMLHNCQKKIRLCDNVKDVEELVKIYYGNVVKGQFYGRVDRAFAIENV